MIAVKNERSSANHVIFNEVIKIFILLVEDGKVGLLWQFVEQIEQGQTRYADALLEQVYAALLVECKLSVDSLLKGNHVPIVVPDEKVSQSRHAAVAPGLLTRVILVGNTFVLQSTLSMEVRCLRASPDGPCTRTGNDLSSPRIRTPSELNPGTM